MNLINKDLILRSIVKISSELTIESWEKTSLEKEHCISSLSPNAEKINYDV